MDERKRQLYQRLSLVRQNYVLYLLLLPALAYVILFNYAPIYGVQIAFKDFHAGLGIAASPWVGLKHFEKFFRSPMAWQIIRNTIVLSGYQLIASFPMPVILALLINQCRGDRFKKLVQNVTYAPYFISTVVLIGMMQIMFSPNSGVINTFIKAFGGNSIFFFGEMGMFRHMYVWSGVWQKMGFDAIIYIAALSGVSMETHEAAIVDGASKFKRMIYIDFPSIVPTMMIMLILAVGQIMSIGFEKVYLMQNSINSPVSEIISTYIYKKGLINVDYGLSSAIGLLNNVVNCVLLFTVNRISGKLTGSSLW